MKCGDHVVALVNFEEDGIAKGTKGVILSINPTIGTIEIAWSGGSSDDDEVDSELNGGLVAWFPVEGVGLDAKPVDK